MNRASGHLCAPRRAAVDGSRKVTPGGRHEATISPGVPHAHDPPLRVVRVLAKLEPGGAQLTALRLTRALGRHRVQVTVLAGEASERGIELFARAGVPVGVWGGEAGLQYGCSAAFSEWLEPRLAEADLVHAHMFGAWRAAARAIRSGVPLVASEHNSLDWPGEPCEVEARAALVRVDRFFAHGPEAGRFALERGLPSARLAEGLSIIDPRVPEPHRALISPRLVYAGRLHEEKGPDVLLEALARMSSPPTTYLLGCGPMEAELRRQAAGLGLDPVVRFSGWCEEPSRWLRGAAACVVPSRREAWSQTAVQAMALGTPVVGSDVEGLPLTLGEGRGLIVEAEDPEALASALSAVVSRRRVPDLAAARRYSIRFHPEPVAAIYARTYRALVESRRRPLPGRGARPDRRARAALGAGPRGRPSPRATA